MLTLHPFSLSNSLIQHMSHQSDGGWKSRARMQGRLSSGGAANGNLYLGKVRQRRDKQPLGLALKPSPQE
jgi:hypothetical protein